jgi:hypothetical protein
MEHRYLMAYVPLAFLLVGGGISRVGEMTARPYGLVIAPVLALAWVTWPSTIWARATDPIPGKNANVVSYGTAIPMTLALRTLAAAPAGDHLVDCAMVDARVRLYPRDVRTIPSPSGLSASCAKLLAGGPDRSGTTWMIIRVAPADARWPGWTTAWQGEADARRAGDGQAPVLVVLRGAS